MMVNALSHKKKRTVVILGAGASYGSTVKVPPPLMNDFIKTGRLRGLNDEYNRLWSFLQDIGYKLDDLEKGIPDFETLYSTLDAVSAGLWYKFSNEYLKNISNVYFKYPPVQFLESFIIEVIKSSTLLKTKVATCKHHDKLINSLEPGDAVISLNYDLIVDSSIKRLKKWSEVNGYGFWSLGTIDGKSNIDTFAPHEEDILLLKPHGSLNWGISRNLTDYSDEDNRVNLHERIQRVEQSKIAAIRLDDIKRLHEIGSHILTMADRIDYNRTMIPEEDLEKYSAVEHYEQSTFIIPPTMFKFGGKVSDIMANVWSNMFEALSTANRVVCIGIKFNTGDIHFNTLLRIATLYKKELIVGIVNPDISIVDNLSSLFPHLKFKHLASSLDEYVS